MLHEKVRSDSPNTSETAPGEYKYSKSGWGKKRKRRLYLYRVYPPGSKPFLPSDEALRMLVATIPAVRFHKSARFSNRDFFFVYGANKNIFTARADARARELRKGFLRGVGALALPYREVPAYVQEAAREFLSSRGFVSVEWTGKQLIAYDMRNKRLEGRLVTEGIYWRPFREFERICRPILPFIYRAAPS